MHSHEIAQAFENLEVLSHDPKSRALYEARKKTLLDIDNGMYVNRLEGIAEGIVEGKVQKALEMAKNLKFLGVATEIIMKASGLSKEQIEVL